MLWMARERIRRFQAASFISPSMNGTPSMTWVMSLLEFPPFDGWLGTFGTQYRVSMG